MWSLLIKLLLLNFTIALQSAPPYGPSQFSNIGMINALTVNNASELFSGGTITIDGITMVVPKNSYVTLPSISVMWSELFENNVPQLPLFGSPGISWEATVFGNRVGDDYICGIIYITQSSARFIQGFINVIDLSTGEFWIAGSSATPGSGIRARLNDPSGRFGLEYWDNPLWTIDAESPSVTAGTGYPLCIPRYANGTDDPLCPMKNRVINGDTPTFIQFKPASSRSDTDPDPNIMAPLIVGDYVTVNGIEVEGGLLAVYSLVANLGLYTAPSELPSYIRVEEARIGVPGPANAELGETRAVAYTTDPATPMQFYAIDVDPCTGVETTRNLQLAQPFSNNAGDVWGKGLFRLGKLNTVPITKSVGFTQLTGTTVTANGLVAGVFIQPVMLYIMPELLVFGDEMFPFNFNQFEYLSLGSGPFIEAKSGPEIEAKFPIVGQLDPWPGATAPGTPTCVIPTPTTIVTATETATETTTETGTTLITTTSSSATSTPLPSRDTVTILSADEEKGKGVSVYTIVAISSQTTEPLPTLVATGTGVNDLGASPMTSLGGGNYILEVSVKHGLDTITVTSSLGGQMTLTLN